MIGFVIWSLLGVFIIGLGIKDMFSKNPVGFWANTETIKVKDAKGYNCATGRLFIIYGIVFIILGIPLLEGQNTPYILWSVIGVMVETIAIMAVYSLGIVKKYEEKSRNYWRWRVRAGGCYRSSPKRGGSDCYRTYGPRGKKDPFYRQRQV